MMNAAIAYVNTLAESVRRDRAEKYRPMVLNNSAVTVRITNDRMTSVSATPPKKNAMLCRGIAASRSSITNDSAETSLPHTRVCDGSSVVRSRSYVWCSRSPLIAPEVNAGAMNDTSSISIATTPPNRVRPISPTFTCPLTCVADSDTAT